MAERSFNIKFVSIEIVSKSISEPPFEGPQKISCTFGFNVDIRIGADLPLPIALVVSDVNITEVSTKEPLAKFRTMCVFEFSKENFNEYFKKVGEAEQAKYDMPVELEIILKSAGLSTTRGIIFSELRGTYLHGAVLPLIDVAKIILANRQDKDRLIKEGLE